MKEMLKGVVYVAYGTRARKEATESIRSLRLIHDYPVMVISDEELPSAKTLIFDDGGARGRWAKINLYKLSPFEDTLYLDADTRVLGDLSVGFRLLDTADLVLVASASQGCDALRHLSSEEREYTLARLPHFPLHLNTGVMYWRRNDATCALFKVWQEEWLHFKDKDQGALLRALNRNPIVLRLLGRPFNSQDASTAVVLHLFGRCR